MVVTVFAMHGNGIRISDTNLTVLHKLFVTFPRCKKKFQTFRRISFSIHYSNLPILTNCTYLGTYAHAICSTNFFFRRRKVELRRQKIHFTSWNYFFARKIWPFAGDFFFIGDKIFSNFYKHVWSVLRCTVQTYIPMYFLYEYN